MKGLVLVVLYLTSIHGYYYNNRVYDNSQYESDVLIKLYPKVYSQMNALKDYMEEKEFDVWNDCNRQGHSCLVRLHNYQLKTFKQFCKKQKIYFDFMSHNVKKLLDEHMEETMEHHSYCFNYTNYNTYQDIEEELFRLEDAYHHTLKVECVGYSYEGRPLYIAKVSDRIRTRRSKRKPIIWIDSGIHAREWISIAVGMNMMKNLLDGHHINNETTRLLNKYVFYFIPVFNPDGYVYSWSTERLWRKTRSPIANSNCSGVDPNRNFNYQWNTTGSSNNPCSLVYHGTKPESEPCVKIYSKVLRKIKKKLKIFYTLHSFLQLFLYPYSFSLLLPQSFRQNFQVGRAFTAAVSKRFNTPYLAAPTAFVLSPTGGVAIDYVHDVINTTYAYVIELRDRGKFGFLLPADQIQPNTDELIDGIIATIKTIETFK